MEARRRIGPIALGVFVLVLVPAAVLERNIPAAVFLVLCGSLLILYGRGRSARPPAPGEPVSDAQRRRSGALAGLFTVMALLVVVFPDALAGHSDLPVSPRVAGFIGCALFGPVAVVGLAAGRRRGTASRR